MSTYLYDAFDCFYHVTYEFQSESALYICLNVKELHARNRHHIWGLSDSKGTLNGWVFVYESLVFLIFNLDFDASQHAFLFVILAKIFFDSCLRALYKKKPNLWSSQDKTIEIYSNNKYLFTWKIFIQSVAVQK